LGNGIYLMAIMRKDELLVDIREYDVRDGNMSPKQNGVVFNKSRWTTFLLHLQDIDACVQKVRENKEAEQYEIIAVCNYVTISEYLKYINIQEYFRPPNATKDYPTRAEIGLLFTEWDELLRQIQELHKHIPELMGDKPCYSFKRYDEEDGE
jgi:Transcriptional Coactivator p15 (PC4)